MMRPILFLLVLTTPAHPHLSAQQRHDAYVMRVCGPEGATSEDNPPGRPACNRFGWNGRSYRRGGRRP